MKKLTFADAPSVLFHFESKYFDEIKDHKVEGWNIWQICKIGIFYNIINEIEQQSNKNIPLRIDLRLKSRAIILNIKSIIKYFLKSFSKDKVLFLTHSADKLSKDETGRFYNSIIYPIFDLNIFDKKIILENPAIDGFKNPSKYDWDLNKIVFNKLSAVFYKTKKDKASYNIIVNNLTQLLNNYFQQAGYIDVVSDSYLLQCIDTFLKQKNYAYRLLKHLKVPLIIGSEYMGSGIMAAANELKIPFVEIQHGSIDYYYPPYVWDSRFNGLGKVIKPSKLLVFGNVAKSIITRTGFFMDNEVYPIGFWKMEETRSRFYTSSGKLAHKILVVIQPMMHDFNLKLIEELLKVEMPDYQISFKAHPLQPSSEITEYQQLMQGSNIQIIDKNESIYALITNSDLIIGHVTTCLEEALSLGKPSITIATEQLPQGIHSQSNTTELLDAIRPCDLSGIKEMLYKYYEDDDYRELWNNIILEKKYLIYSSDYRQKVKLVFDEYLN